MIAVFFVTDSLTQFSAGICILILSPIVFLQKTKSFFNLVFLYLMDQIKLFFCGAANCLSGCLYFPTPDPGSGLQFVFTGPAAPQFVFTGPVPNLYLTALVPNMCLPALATSLCLAALGPNLYLLALASNLLFTSSGQKFTTTTTATCNITTTTITPPPLLLLLVLLEIIKTRDAFAAAKSTLNGP